MNTKTTEAVLLSKVAELTRTIEMLQCVPTPKVRPISKLRRHIETPVEFGIGSDLDLNYVDHVRESLRRRVASELADELLRSGAIQISETLTRDPHYYGARLRLSASVDVIAA
ncbi:hypothetical protein [Luteibacter sp. 22Crub2.1]|uniref:hypothetical protein n=1 Tax=Luteibacter sp. 22Crub2.1 TaxID=1283288 RepID=UPI0009A7C8E1|nr:hypothetical protein [Luteibacter sp. 22Crub2.1]SKB50544.1 hypothetical protein SAMN05660880_01358 [Luteibacter sp. 22Crub2.1]